VPEESFEERSEAASPKRRQDAREKGNVAKSTEINSVLVLLISIMVLRYIGPWMWEQLGEDMVRMFRLISGPRMGQATVMVIVRNAVILFFKVSLPLTLAIMVTGVLANVIQIGFLATVNPIMPKLEKINPLTGFQRMFSMRSIVEALKGVFKMLIIGIVSYITIKGEYVQLLTIGDTSVSAIWLLTLLIGFKIVFRVILILIVLAVLDYAYQRYEHEKKLKMTRQEVKEERKQMEGDPQVKMRIRSLQREMARRRMMEEVPKATVVVTNPTTLALAIRYESATMRAPIIVAKGRQLVAERIKQIAREKNIPVVEDKLLARAMYDLVEPGDEVPVEFYNAVAEILAYVYKLQNKVAA
jgi:flagellar biosynthetic protein FlhB